MDRRTFGRVPVVLTVALAAILGPSASTRAADLSNRPNIVVILADDLGYGDVACLNPKRGKIATPNLDRLASEGMTFTDAHSGSSVCTPTRYGLLTGRYAWRTRLQKGVLSNYDEPLIAADRLTLPGLLQKNGYTTACIGKWHLGFTVDQRPVKGAWLGAPIGAKTSDGPISRGFDQFFGFHHARMMKSVFENDRVTRFVEPVEMLSLLAEQASQYVEQQAKVDRPFFLYFALSSPHTPIVPSPTWKGKSGLGDYADFVMETDWAVGRVREALDKTGLAKNTIVIASSDNGCSPQAGVAALEAKGHYPSAEYRGYKSDIWEGGHRVPFLVRWPGVTPPGSRSSQLVCLTDLLATAAEVVGAKLPENAGEDSFSFLPDLRGDGHSARTRVVHHSINGKFAIREGSTKLCLCRGSGGWTKGGDPAPIQLYDLAKAPAESKNIQADHPEEVERLSRILDTIIADGRSTPGKPQQNDVPVRVEFREP